MTGFLPFSIASHGAAPQAVPEAAFAPHTGADGAFAAVLAELAGNGAVADGLPQAGTPFGLTQAGQPAVQGGAQPAIQAGGSAMQRLKLAFAGSGAMPATFDLGGFEVNVDAIRFVRSGDAPAAGMNIEELAAIAPQAGGAPEAKPVADKIEAEKPHGEKPAVEAGRQPVIAEIQPEQVRPEASGETAAEGDAPRPVAERPTANRKAKAADAAPAEMAAPAAQAPAAQAQAHPVNIAYSTATTAAPEQAAPKSATPKSATPAAEAGVAPAAPAADAAAPAVAAPAAPEADAQPRTDVEQRDVATPRHDLAGRGETRPLAATVTQLSTEPAQAWDAPQAETEVQAQAQAQAQAQVQPRTQASTSAPADEAMIATLAALAPAAGQAASAVRAPAAEQRRGAAAPTADGVTADAAMDAPEAGPAIKPEAAPEAARTQIFAGLTAAMPEKAQAAAAAPAMTDKPAVAAPAADATGRSGPALSGPERAPTAEAGAVQPGLEAARTDDARTAQPARPAVTAEQETVQQAPSQPASNQTASNQPTGSPTPTAQALPEGFQPLHAAQGLAQGYGAAAQPAAQPHGADVVKVATPQQLPEAMGLAISRHASAEATEFTLRLDPAELGRVEVKLEMGKDGRTTVSVQADNASTFDLLRRDSSALERALADAGLKLDSGGLNFSLRQQDGQNQQQYAGEGGQRPATGRMQEASLAGPEQDNTPRPTRRSNASGLLDLSI